MGFNIAIGKDESLFPQMGVIAKRYFSVDTASSETAYDWYRHNPWAVITATINGTVHGFSDFLPLTSEAIELLETGRLIEEDIRPEHILPPESMHYCRAIYFSGIAIRDKGTFLGARCAGALVAAAGHLLTSIYGNAKLERIYTNPTTYSGNRLVRRMGFTPVKLRKRNVNGMDLYELPFDDEQRKKLADLYALYQPKLIDTIDLSLDKIPPLL